MSLTTKEKGELVEMKAAANLMEMGYTVAEPYGETSGYDLLIDGEYGIHRAQVKTGTFDDGVVKANFERTTYDSDGVKSNHYSSDEVDCYIIYCFETEETYWVDFEEAPKTRMHLRVDDTQNGQNGNVNWASDYEITT